jgi:hypothetical protein
MLNKIILAILISIAFVSCQKLADPIDTKNPELTGSWIKPQYVDTLVTYTRAENLVENQYGIKFEANSKLILRQNSGWCGTPPISTADYAGAWNWNDSILKITTGYWGGTVDLTWKIIMLKNRELVIYVMKSEYHQGK